ncbi:hypothetical protein [Emticicia fluvialis]|uniref:hypothetical protein n=1 Tax=Emticicia fluvialis TaxID=2974474 RepID=UPI002165FCE1|nr:hypothetical protein [Emticicia fluvialis]
MANYSKEILQENVFNLLHFSGITDEQFANILEISLRKLKYVKKRESEFTIADVNKIALFFDKSFAEITTKKVEVNRNFRNELLSIHRKNVEYRKILEDRPSIPYAIEFILVFDPEFKNSEFEVKQILQVFRKYGWNYRSPSVSKELKNMSSLILSKPHPQKKGINLYFKAVQN